VVVFTLLLRATTALIDIPQMTWQLISGVILIALGIVSIFPRLWDAVSTKLSLQRRSDKRLVAARERGGTLGAILTGAALGPVFTSCSPLYLYVIVAVLPASFAEGVVLLLAYAIGLCGTLLLVSLLGQKVIGKARWIANPDGNFKRLLGIIFVLVGIAVILGIDKDLQFWILENSPIRLWELDKGFIPAG
jgi:cytochrome c biogenesis protein CcdA